MEKLKSTEATEGTGAAGSAEKVEDRKEKALEMYAKSVGIRMSGVLIEGYEKKTDGRVLAFAELSKIIHEQDPSVPVVEMAPNASMDEVKQQAEALAAAAERIVKDSGIDVTNNNNGQPYPEIVTRLSGFDTELPWGMITGSLMTPDRADKIRAADADRKRNPRRDTGEEERDRYPGFGKGGF